MRKDAARMNRKQVTDAQRGPAVQALREWLPSTVPLTALCPPVLYPMDLYDVIAWHGKDYPPTVRELERLRDAVFLPLAKDSADPQTYPTFFAAIAAVVFLRSAMHGDVFATEEIRTAFLVLLQHAYRTGGECATSHFHLFRVLAQLTSSPVGAAVFCTAAVRDTMFVACADIATNPEQRYFVLIALSQIAGAKEGKLFATTAIRDNCVVPCGRSLNTPSFVEYLFRTITKLSWAGSGCGFELFHNFTMRDKVFMPLAKYVTTDAAASWFFAALKETVTVKPRPTGSALFATKAVRDKLFVAVAKHVSERTDAESCFEAMSNILSDRGDVRRRELFAVKSVRDAVILPLLKWRPSASSVMHLLMSLVDCPAGPALFGTAACRDQLFLPMVPAVIEENDHDITVMFLASVVSDMCVENHVRDVFATPVARDRIFIPMGNATRSQLCSSAVIRALESVLCGRHSASRIEVFATPEVRDVLVRLARIGCSDSGRLFVALGYLVTWSSRTFATRSVRDDIFVGLFETVTAQRTAHALALFCEALRCFGGTFREKQEGADRAHSTCNALLSTERHEAPLCFRMEVLVLVAERATSVGSAAGVAWLVSALQSY